MCNSLQSRPCVWYNQKPEAGSSVPHQEKAMNKLAIIPLLVLASAALAAGCVSRTAHEGRVTVLLEQLHRERVENNAEKQLLETKVRERGRTLSGLTEMYMKVKEQNDISQGKLGRLEGDLEALQRDLSELKLVIYTNIKGAHANEMILKLNEMQRRVQGILEKSGEPAPDEVIGRTIDAGPDSALE